LKKIVIHFSLFIILILSLGNAHSAEASLFNKVVNSVRPYVVEYIGESFARKIFGESNTIELPLIPKVVKESTSTKSLPQDPNENLIPKEKINAYSMRYLTDIYLAVLAKKPNRNDIGKWMNVLTQGGTREGVYRGLVYDSSYASLEEVGPETSNESAAFSAYFMEKFLNKKISINKIKSASFYTVKRNVVEKSLDIADQFLREGRVEDFFNWYSLISMEIAKKNMHMWNRKLRSNSNPLVHKEWTSVVPRQMVKSELIIKLHLLLNYLNTQG